MRNKMKIWLILITLLTAFMGETKVESPFVCMGEKTTGSQVITHGEAKVNTEICTTEMLGIHNNRITLFVLSVFVFMQMVCFTLGRMEVLPVRSCFSEELITIYMHKSDGKKRI